MFKVEERDIFLLDKMTIKYNGKKVEILNKIDGTDLCRIMLPNKQIFLVNEYNLTFLEKNKTKKKKRK